MSKLFEEMAQGTAEARAYMEGERKGYEVTLPAHFETSRLVRAECPMAILTARRRCGDG